MAQRPVAEVFKDIFDNVQDIVRSEARLASAQLREELENSVKTLRWNAVAALSGFLGLAFLLICGFFALRYTLSAWAAAAIISVSLGAVCGLSLLAARKQRSSTRSLSSPSSRMQ
jgi:uncharacterized membrane protein YqjE